jgi:hypothetical protein
VPHNFERIREKQEHDFLERAMTKQCKDLKYKASEEDLDLVLKMKVRQWMTAKPRLIESDLQLLFQRMHEFAREIRFGGFGPALKKLTGDGAESSRAVHLTELIADTLCQGIDVSDNGIQRKSLQETLYFCTGITPQLLQPEFGRRFDSFLALSGSKGFIRVFLSVHLSNLIFRDLYDSLVASAPEELRARTEVIEKMCQKVAATAVAPLKDWLEPNHKVISTLLLDLNAEIMRMLSDRIAFHRGA